MAVKYPDILEHNNSTKALLDDSQLRGAAIAVADATARNTISEDKRKQGMIVTYVSGSDMITKRYTNSNIGDTAWTTEANWELIGASGGSGNPFDQDLNTTNTPTFVSTTLTGSGVTNGYKLGSNTEVFETGGALGLKNASSAWYVTTDAFSAASGLKPALLDEITTSTNPSIVPNYGDKTTGIGGDGASSVCLIAGGVEAIKVNNSLTRIKATAIALGLNDSTPYIEISNNSMQTAVPAVFAQVITLTSDPTVTTPVQGMLRNNAGTPEFYSGSSWLNLSSSPQSPITSSIVAGAVDLDLSASKHFIINLTENITINNPTNATVGETLILEIRQDVTAGRTVAWGNNYKNGTDAPIAISNSTSAYSLVTGLVDSNGAIIITSITDITSIS